jgi:tetratricopeptide (TPR) repeat protein
MEIPVTTSHGQLSVTLEYPAGQLRREAFPAMIPLEEADEDLDFDDEDFEGEDLSVDVLNGFPSQDLPGNGRAQSSWIMDEAPGDEMDLTDEDEERLADWEASPIAARNPALVQAMALVYEAWDEIDPARRIQLCRQALETSPDCAEAYVLLAEDLAVNLGQMLKYYQKGVEAGERALEREFFEQHRGDFWRHVEARPYLRARARLTRTLWELDRIDEALENSRELLRLDEDDNLSVHYAVLLILLETGQTAEAYQFAKTVDDPQASWQYTIALLDFQQTGDSPEAQAQLRRAFQANRYVPDYLSGRKRLPVNVPEFFRPGQKSEAIDYATAYMPFWRQTQGAIDWLRKHTRADEKPAKTGRITKSGNKKKRR